jgi:hypothetical protein
MQRFVVFLSLPTVVLVGAATGTLASARALESAAAEHSVAVPSSLVGRWSRTVVVDYTKIGAPTISDGRWTMNISRNGAIVHQNPERHFVHNSVSGTGNQLVFKQCLEEDVRGPNLYTWKLSGKLLTITVVRDKKCIDRAALYSGVWKRQ